MKNVILSKFFSWAVVGGIVLAALLVFEVSTGEASTKADFIQISVLADGRADYGVDQGMPMIPSISVDIVSDKLHDEGKTSSSLPVILFRSNNPSDRNVPDAIDVVSSETTTVESTTDNADIVDLATTPTVSPTENANNGNRNGNGNGGGNGNRNGNGNSGGNGNGNGNGNSSGNGNGNGNGNAGGNGNGNGNSNDKHD